MAASKAEGMRMGPITLVTLISVLLLSVLAVLCVTTSNATQAMAQRHAQATAETYAIDACGQAMVAGIGEATQGASSAASAAANVGANLESIKTAALQKSSASGLSIDANVSEGSVTFTVSTESGKALSANIGIAENGSTSINEWRLTTTQTATEETLWSSGQTNQ